MGIFKRGFKGSEKRSANRIPVPILVEALGREGTSFRAKDLSEDGFSIEVVEASPLASSEAGDPGLEFNIVVSPDEEPINVVAKAVWTLRSEDGTLTLGWVFSAYRGDGKERLSALVRADHDMQRVQAKDEAEFDFSQAEIFQAIMDPRSYTQWWPAVIRHRILDSTSEHPESPRIEISPFGVSRFCCEIESLRENEEVAYRYYAGACLGIGIWTLTPNAEKTLLTYEINLAIKSRLIQLASIFIDLRKLHSRNMGWIFRGLRRYLAKQRH